MLSTNNKMSTNLIAKNMKKFLHHRNAKLLYWKYMSSISQFINNLCGWIYYILYMFFYSETKITHFYLLSFAFIRFHLLYHSLSFAVVTRCCSLSFVATRCHSLHHALPLALIRCINPCHSLSLVVICCHSL